LCEFGSWEKKADSLSDSIFTSFGVVLDWLIYQPGMKRGGRSKDMQNCDNTENWLYPVPKL
jgi:hypothetical protein